MIINLNQFGGGGAGGHDSTKLDVTAFNTYTQEQATIDESQNTAINDIETDITGIKSKIEDIELFKFPNATIIGEPTIQNGQVSDFSTVSYLQFPFIVDLHNKAFEINFCFTTATNVQTQQNILDSKFGLALAIKDGKGLMAISSNGTSWNIGNTTGTMNIESNTTYYAKLTWNGIQYKTALSTNGEDYTEDMVLVGAQAPHPTTIFIGGCDTLATGHEPHPFLGTINLNNANLIISGNVVWSGMDDAGLATRMATDMSNIDEAGIEKVKEIVADEYLPLSGGTMTGDINISDIVNIGKFDDNEGGIKLSTSSDAFRFYNSNNIPLLSVIDSEVRVGNSDKSTKIYLSIHRAQQGGNKSRSDQYVNYTAEDEMQWRLENKYSSSSISSEMILGVHGLKLRYSGHRNTATSGDWKTVATTEYVDGKIDTITANTFNMSVEFEDGTTGNYVVVQKV